jgi:membrane-anchored protein YejM (alkaline phosphatase superfamily)
VFITSDHGEEFEDDNHQGFHGHGSSYSDWQLHTPAALRWPGRAAGVVTRRTSHNDVAPTLLSGVLGCSNPPSDYASGRSLFSEEEWPWLVASSYTNFAIVEPDEITVSHGTYYEVRDHRYRLLAKPGFDSDLLAAAIRETGRFFRR